MHAQRAAPEKRMLHRLGCSIHNIYRKLRKITIPLFAEALDNVVLGDNMKKTAFIFT
jgi:hypothetical protein